MAYVHFQAILIEADKPRADGTIIPAEEARKLADGYRLLWDEEKKFLWYMGDSANWNASDLLSSAPMLAALHGVKPE